MEVKKIYAAWREKNVGGRHCIYFVQWIYAMKGRKGGNAYILRRKMLNKQRRKLFNQQRVYYREFIYKSKANNFQIKKYTYFSPVGRSR